MYLPNNGAWPRITAAQAVTVSRYAVVLLCISFFLSGCAILDHDPSSAPSTDSNSTHPADALKNSAANSDIKLLVGPKYKDYDQNQSAVWIAHALAKLRCESAYPRLSFDNEFCAINTALEIWRDIKEKEAVNEDTLDDMEEVKRAGFLREYVWVYWHQDYWFKPEALLLDKFNAWRAKHLLRHQANNNPDIVAVKTKIEIEPRFEPNTFNSGYPDTIGNFHYISDGRYFPMKLGASVRYQIDRHSPQRGYAEIYIYDIPESQRSSERKSLTLAISSQVKAEILSLQKHDLYHEFSVVSEDSLSELPEQPFFVRGVYRFTANHVKYFSTLYLCLTEDKIFKVRITYPDNPHNQKGDHFKDFVLEAFKKIMTKNKQHI